MDATLPVQLSVSLVRQLLPEPHAGLLLGILFGTKEALSKPLVEALIQTGTLHIVALSGMNISIVSKLCHTTLLRFFSRRIASLLTGLAIIGFVWLVGASPSVIRAAIMGILTVVSVALGRPKWAIYTFLITVALMLIVNPSWLGELSFQLSALATLGIILFSQSNTGADARYSFSALTKSAPSIHELDGKEDVVMLKNEHLTAPKNIIGYVWHLIEDDLRITLAAQVFTIPLIFLTFHRISLVSPLTNILIGFLIAPLTVLGYILTVIGFVFHPMAQIISWILWVMLEYMIQTILLTSRLPFAGFSL